MSELEHAARQALEACKLIVSAFDALKPASAARNEPLQINAARASITALEAALAEPVQGPMEFDNSLGADRFKVVRGAFWWHVLIGDSTTEHGKFRSRASAEKMAFDLLREFRNGAFVQHDAIRARGEK